jgi:hypothetical protein
VEQEPEKLELTLEELSLAWEWLQAPPGYPIPEKFKYLHPIEWLSLGRMLEVLMEEKEQSTLH